jgi:hypothetical protein
MSDEPQKDKSQADADLEREIRAERKFSLAEAIGRLGGPGIMKGVSPVTRLQQAEAEIREYLDRHLADSAGVLSGIIHRRVAESESLLRNPDHPLAVLAASLRSILDCEYLLKDLVREADAEWGRVYGERPHFDQEGRPPDPDDPYTNGSVRAALCELIAKLGAGGP